jgi:hypothetical protein
MKKSLNFYLEKLGGVLIGSVNSLSGNEIRNSIFSREIKLGDINVPDMDKYFFDSYLIYMGGVIIELIRLRDNNVLPDDGEITGVFLKYHESTSPAFKNNMHFAFLLNDIDINGFVFNAYENSAPGLICNKCKLNTLSSELIYNSFYVKNGHFKGWTLAYCKGIDGEQFEFNLVNEKALDLFKAASNRYMERKVIETATPVYWDIIIVSSICAVLSCLCFFCGFGITLIILLIINIFTKKKKQEDMGYLDKL